MHRNNLNKYVVLPAIFAVLASSFPLRTSASSASLSLSPSTGSFVVDSTFDVSIFLDTGGVSVNAVELTLKFPPDKIQLVSSSTGGKSIIGIWPTLPKFNNQTGTVQLTGGIPNGVVVSKGLISTLTFRARSIGSAVVKIEQSKVLSNDGSGTEIATQNSNSVFQVILPPPAGPLVVSDTHPDQGQWYKEKNVSLKWGDEGGLDGFSYMISDIAVDLPDDISEGTSQSVLYKSVSEGRHYFHIKGLRNGQWGGVSHYPINIDSVAPAEFEIEIVPRPRTTRKQPVIQFETTDAMSGMDHYELKLLDLQRSNSQPLFIEATSPFVTQELDTGSYDVIIRAYDKANNHTEATRRIEIVPALLRNIGDQGLELRSTLVMPWPVVWLVFGIGLVSLLFLAIWFKRRHDRLHHQVVQQVLPVNLQDQLSELQQYRDKYGKILAVIIALSTVFMSTDALAQTQVLTPPLIKTINKNLSNDELFYAGGFTGIPESEVVLFLQNLETGETLQINVKSDKAGEWFYRHDEFLSSGDYLLWGQSKAAGQVSPPTSQISLTVDKKALEFGSSKISLPVMYLGIIVILLLALASIGIYIWIHSRKIRRKREIHLKRIQEAEESIRRGFAVLNRDFQKQLDLLNQKKSKKRLTYDEELMEQHLVQDMQSIQRHLSEEIWELEQMEQN